MSAERKLHLGESISVEVDRRKGVKESEDRLKEEQKELRIAELDGLLLQLNTPELLKNLRDEVWGFGKIVRAASDWWGAKDWRGECLSYSLVAKWLYFQAEYTIESEDTEGNKYSSVVAEKIGTHSAAFSVGAIAIPPCEASHSLAVGLYVGKANPTRYITIHNSRISTSLGDGPYSAAWYIRQLSRSIPRRLSSYDYYDQSSRDFRVIDGWRKYNKKPGEEVWKLTGGDWCFWNPGKCSELLETGIVDLLIKEKEKLSSPKACKEDSMPSVENAVKRGVELPEGAENLEGYSFSRKK